MPLLFAPLTRAPRRHTPDPCPTTAQASCVEFYQASDKAGLDSIEAFKQTAVSGNHVVSGPDGVTNTGVAFLQEKATWQEQLSFSCGGSAVNTDRAEAAAAAGLQSRMIIPVALNGEVLAVLNFYSKEAKPPNEQMMHHFQAPCSPIPEYAPPGT